MTNREKKLLAMCVRHLEEALKAQDLLLSDRKFSEGKVTVSEVTYFKALAAADSVFRIKEILRERIGQKHV